MNPNDKMKGFLTSLNESVTTPEQKKLLEAIMEAFSLFESNPYIFAGKKEASPVTRQSRVKPSTQTPEEIDAANAARKKREIEANRLQGKDVNELGGRLAGILSQLINAAEKAPDAVEKLIKSEKLLKSIKSARQATDDKFGTDTAKKSIGQRFKNAIKGFTESTDMDSFESGLTESESVLMNKLIEALENTEK